MPVIPFGEWLPDQAALGNPGALVAKNVVPSPSGYRPVGSLQPLTDALEAAARGAIAARDKDGAAQAYAGDAAKLYRLSGASWVAAASGFTTGDEERWRFARWDNKVLGTNFSDVPQQITMGATSFGPLTTAFRCRDLAVVGDFVVAGNTVDAIDGAVPNRVRWSAFNDPEDWTVSPVTLSGFKTLKSAGAVQRVLGGEYGVVVTENSTWRLSFVAAPKVFQDDNVLPGVGAWSPGAVAQLGDTVFLWSPQGVIALTNGVTHELIGAGKVDETLGKELDEDNRHRISTAVDPRAGRVFFGYPGPGNVMGRPNRIVCYDRGLKRWAGPIEREHELLWSAFGVATTLEDLDALFPSLDEMDISLDSARFKGSGIALAAFDEAHRSGFFDGEAMAAEIDSAERELQRGRNTRLQAFRVLVDGPAAVTARVAARRDLSETPVFGPPISRNGTGRFPCQLESKYFRFRVNIPAGWSDAQGVLIEREDARPASRR